MELDELKTTWQVLQRQLQRQNALDFALLKEKKLARARSSLRPLFWGQCLQMLLGLAMLALGVATWTQHRELPHLLVAGILLHVYGVLAIALGGVTMNLGRVDPDAPVVVLQKRMARLRRTYIVSGMVLGLSWWLLWGPVVMCLGALAGVDVLAHWPALAGWCLGIGVPGLLLSWGFHRWSRAPRRAALGRRLDDQLAGSGIVHAQAVLDEIGRFEHE